MAVLNADKMDLITSEPDKPIRWTTFTRGDEVTGLSEEREAELRSQGVLVDSLDPAADSTPPGDSEAPKSAQDAEPPATGADYRTEPADPTRVPAGPSSDPVTLTADAAGDLTGDRLKAELEARQLSTSGSVADKQARLVAAVSGAS